MIRRPTLMLLPGALALALVLLPQHAAAQTRVQLFLTGAAGQAVTPRAHFGSGAVATERLTFSLFAAELGAFLAKEIISDSDEEFRSSPIPSRLNSVAPESRSEFGTHCLTIVTKIGDSLPSLGFSSAERDLSASVATAALETAATSLALREIWSAFRKDIEGDRRGFSLDPKVGARQVRVNLVFHW